MKEIFKQINSYPKHKISNFGRIWSLNYNKFLKVHQNYLGYTKVSLSYNKKTKKYSVHRLVALHFIHNPKNKPVVNHKDSNRKNNISSNLEWCTISENINHSIKFGNRIPINGEKIGTSKLTKKKVKKIRQIYSGKKTTQKKLSIIYNVSEMTIYRIINNLSWKHL